MPMLLDNIESGPIKAKNRFRNVFFVVKNIPFVGMNKTLNRPFVCLNKPFRDENGFTLIELIVTLVVAAIILTIAVPSMREVLQRTRLTTQANNLMADIALAKSQALGKGVVVICSSSNGNVCDGAGWNSGRLIFADAPPNNFTYTAGVDRLIKYSDPLPAGSIQVAATTFPDPLIINTEGDLVDVLMTKVIALAAAPGAGAPLFVDLCDVQRRVPGRTIELRTKMSTVVSNTPPACP